MICADVVHSLKGEFLNIGGSNQEIRDLSHNSPEILEECELIQRSLEYSQIRLQNLIDYLNLSKPRTESIEIEQLVAEVASLSRQRDLNWSIELRHQVYEGFLPQTLIE